jgi:hypothetical protein
MKFGDRKKSKRVEPQLGKKSLPGIDKVEEIG